MVKDLISRSKAYFCWIYKIKVIICCIDIWNIRRIFFSISIY